MSERFSFTEEADYCLRLKLAGYAFKTILNKHVLHAGSATYGVKQRVFMIVTARRRVSL